MSETKVCPGCGRHCDLSEPHCGRGAEYARTGVMPERRPGEGHHGEGHHGEGHHKRVPPYRTLDTNDKLIDNLRNLGRMMKNQYEGKDSQRRILMILNASGPMTQRDLTEYLAIQPGSASEILAKLENAGLILRTQNEEDRRTIDIQLTDEGKTLAEEAVDQRHKRHEEMFSGLSEEEKQTLLTLLEKISSDWKGRYRDHGHGDHHEYHGGHGPHEGKPHGEHGPHDGKPHDGKERKAQD